MHWDSDLDERPEDSIETEPLKEQSLPLTPDELPMEEEDVHRHHITVIADADNTNPDQPEGKEFVDADPYTTELDKNSTEPYAILRDDPFAIIPHEAVKRL